MSFAFSESYQIYVCNSSTVEFKNHSVQVHISIIILTGLLIKSLYTTHEILLCVSAFIDTCNIYISFECTLSLENQLLPRHHYRNRLHTLMCLQCRTCQRKLLLAVGLRLLGGRSPKQAIPCCGRASYRVLCTFIIQFHYYCLHNAAVEAEQLP